MGSSFGEGNNSGLSNDNSESGQTRVIIDCRRIDEYEVSHIPNAKHFEVLYAPRSRAEDVVKVDMEEEGDRLEDDDVEEEEGAVGEDWPSH